MNKWDKRFMDLAIYISSWSKDKSRKVGAVIVDINWKTVVSLGYNGFPRGINDNNLERYKRPQKYAWTEHAEKNAILNADRRLNGCAIYVPWHPCSGCSRAIINSGISLIVCSKPDFDHHKYGKDFEIASEMLNEAPSIKVQYVDIT